jgi:high-affinity nickel-transport protein
MGSRLGQLRMVGRSLTRAERWRLAAMGLVIIGVNLAGWGLFITEVLPSHFHYKGLGIGIGLGITAWTLGMRHAFDADHISTT